MVIIQYMVLSYDILYFHLDIIILSSYIIRQSKLVCQAGFRSDPIKIKSGSRQGDPISC